LKYCLLHILFLLLFISNLRAQTDSPLPPVLLKLTDDLNCLASVTLEEGIQDVAGSEKGVFTEKFKALNPNLFSEILPNASEDYSFLTALSDAQKQRLFYQFYGGEDDVMAQLEAAGLSPSIRFLAPALSAMNIRSKGSDKRAGIWQLTHFQAVLNGLAVNKTIDERFDSGKATQAAIEEILKMKKNFGSDEKAMLALIAGPVNLRNALSAANDSSELNELISALPANASETLALWQAMTVFLTENKPDREWTFPANDTVYIDGETNFQQIAEAIEIPLSVLQDKNPQYPYSIVPASGRKQYLYLPEGKKADFLSLQDSVYALYDSTLFEVVAQKIEYPPAPNRQYLGEKVKDLEIEGKTKIKYTLKSGDVLGFIAEDYDVRVEDLKYWNNIYNERRIQAGQKLDIFVDDADAEYYRNLHPEPLTKSGAKNPAAAASYPIPANAKKIEHVVKSGESPYVIAKQYKGVTPEAILYWNGISDARKIQIGQKLTIYVSE